MCLDVQCGVSTFLSTVKYDQNYVPKLSFIIWFDDYLDAKGELHKSKIIPIGGAP